MKKLSHLLLNDHIILGLILFNSVLIFFQGFELEKKVVDLLQNIDNIITMVFLLELLVKLRYYGIKEFIKSGWNRFDALLILLALPSLFLWFVYAESNQSNFLLIIRISRVFKFFRFIRFLPNVNHLIAGVQRAIKSSIVVLFGFLVYNFIVSVLSCFFYRDIAPVYFSNPVVSFYSIFKIFTIEGWYEIPDYIAQNSNNTIGFFTKIYFTSIVLTGGVFGLSLVNSIFVDAMISDNNDELEKKITSLEKKIDKLIHTQKDK